MDTAVAEYPVLEAYKGDHTRTVTDLDILAFRFAGAVLRHAQIRGSAFAVLALLEKWGAGAQAQRVINQPQRGRNRGAMRVRRGA